MSLSEFTIEDAALTWFGDLGYAVGHAPQLAPSEPAPARGSFAELVLLGCLRKSLHPMSRFIRQSCLLATLHETRRPKLLSG